MIKNFVINLYFLLVYIMERGNLIVVISFVFYLFFYFQLFVSLSLLTLLVINLLYCFHSSFVE